jgi:hypothetical protein
MQTAPPPGEGDGASWEPGGDGWVWRRDPNTAYCLAMGDEREGQDGRSGGTLPDTFVVDWRAEPVAVYVSAAHLDMAPDGVSLVFLDATPAQRRVREVDGERRMMARPVASLRITRPYFYFILKELVAPLERLRGRGEHRDDGQPGPVAPDALAADR